MQLIKFIWKIFFLFKDNNIRTRRNAQNNCYLVTLPISEDIDFLSVHFIISKGSVKLILFSVFWYIFIIYFVPLAIHTLKRFEPFFFKLFCAFMRNVIWNKTFVTMYFNSLMEIIMILEAMEYQLFFNART